MQLNKDQIKALELLRGPNNIFLTGAAGCGKSFLLRYHLSGTKIPILASTGAAAILVGGRTFHSFFGLGIMEGGLEQTVERALKNRRLVNRLKKHSIVVIDEISMISGPTLQAAERITREVRGGHSPWGGMKIIVVGDFFQLPPVNPHASFREWAFLNPSWNQSEFHPARLSEPMRTTEPEYLQVLNKIRFGQCDQQVEDFLNSKVCTTPPDDVTRLYPLRQMVEKHNLTKLNELTAPLKVFDTVYSGQPKDIERFKINSPILDQIQLKLGALVMIRQNDIEGKYVNGSVGHIRDIRPDLLRIELLNGNNVFVERTSFTLLDAEGQPVVAATNFPISLAWAMTIHKAQGTTLDRSYIHLERIWEPGQAYVALSRVQSAQNLYLSTWSRSSIKVDPLVFEFDQKMKHL